VEARFSAPVQTGSEAHPASCTMGIGSFPGVKSGRGVTLTPHPLLVLWSRKGRAILLLPLWAVRPVQSLSACTRVNFTLPICVRLFSFLPKLLPTANQPTSLSYIGAYPYKCTFHLPAHLCTYYTISTSFIHPLTYLPSHVSVHLTANKQNWCHVEQIINSN
jgi:hypothetical protein